MNFLSHYYFEQQTNSPEIVLGTVLPDLLKNANKNWSIHPEKKPDLFTQLHTSAILTGWKRHLEVDRIFHSAHFFNQKMQELKNLLIPILSDSPVRPSFLAHIGVELLLDHLLVTHQKININQFYNQLDEVDEIALTEFLNLCAIDNVNHFFKFYQSFKSSRYLLSYQKLENIAYALQRICMRLWEHPFSEKTNYQLISVLEFYKNQLEVDFMVIFEEIENKLT
jgi:acyl carrier protein phosphodiesterase